jgi:hypothetical protein
LDLNEIVKFATDEAGDTKKMVREKKQIVYKPLYVLYIEIKASDQQHRRVEREAPSETSDSRRRPLETVWR